jgi:CheY-like chemotaxis protein/signal transduction histidine kinase
MSLALFGESWMLALLWMLVAITLAALLGAWYWVRAMRVRMRLAEQPWQQQLTENARVARQRLAEQAERTKGLKSELAAVRQQAMQSAEALTRQSSILADVHRLIAPNFNELTQQLGEYLALAEPTTARREPMALLPVIESALEQVAEQAYDKALRLGYFIDSQMPSIILGDEERLRRSLLSLLEEAIQQTEHGDVTLTIEYTPSQQNIRFVVEDTRALSQSDFSMGSVSEPSTERFSGLKLGLCQRLVAAMGGQVGAHCLAGQGCRFWFEWPLAVYHAQPCLAASPVPVTVAILLPDNRFTAKVATQLQSLNVTLQVYSTVTALIRAIESGALQRVHVLSIDMVTLESFAEETPTLMACLAKLPHTIAWVMTPKQQRNSAKDVLTQANRMAMLKPLRWSLFSQILRKLTFEPMALNPTEGRILLVEENLVNQKVSMALLANMGYEVELASRADEAERHMAQGDYDWVLMDTQIPCKDGYQITREWRDLEGKDGQDVGQEAGQEAGQEGKQKRGKRRLPIIAMLERMSDKEACLAAGMDGFVTKPLSRTALQQALTSNLTGKQ